MSHRLLTTAVLVIALAGQVSAGPSGWDETQLQLLEQYSTPLRWYNVAGPPDWVAGPKPHYHFLRRQHLIRLQPGEAVTLRAAADTWLRLAGTATALRPEDLQISVSSDARGFTATTPLASSNPPSLLVQLPWDKPALVRLTRPAQSGSVLVFAAYLSSLQPFDTIAPYRRRVRLPGKHVRLRRDDETASQPAWLVKPDGVTFSLEGPARVQLVARLPWPEDEPPAEQALTVRLKLDNAGPVPLLLAPELDARHRTHVDYSTQLFSRRMDGFFDVPDGKHTLRLEPTVPVYLSVFLQPHPDYLLPWLNAPATNAQQLPRSNLAAAPLDRISPFELDPLHLSARTLTAQEQAGWQLARDNRPLDAGAQAADWLKRVAQTRPDYPAARQTATEVWHQRTFYREILPARQPGVPPLLPAFFSPKRLLEPFEPHWPVAVYNPTLDQVRQLFAEGRFALLPEGSSPGLLYDLPRRSYDSVLRVAATARGPASTRFFVQFDQQPPVQVVLDGKSALPGEELEPSMAYATLHVLEQEAQFPGNDPQEPPIGEFDLPFPIVDPGTVELPLPQSVRQVRLYREPSEPPVMASVAYRAAKPFELGEAAYLSLLHQAGSAQVLQMLSRPTDADKDAPEPLRSLHNYFLPLMRLLKAHELDFEKNFDLGSAPPTAEAALSAEAARRLKETAVEMEHQGQRIEALGSWNRLFWEGAASDRRDATLSIMRSLESQGEDFLATQYARYALLEAPGQEFPAPAVALLEARARQADDLEQLEQLRAFLFLRCPRPRHLAGLVEALALNSHDEMALAAGLLLPRKQRPNELLLAAALRLNWWRTFDRLVAELPGAGEQCFWRAQKELAFYRFTEAEHDLEQAGTRGAAALRALRDGRHIREQLGAADLKQRLEGVFAWEQWQQHQPGPRTWREAEDVVCSAPASELLFNCEQNQFIQYYRAEPAKPVMLRFLGPLRLQIEARPVLDTPFEKPVDDWLEISQYGITNRIPICQCVPNPALQLTSTSNALVGVKTTVNLDWGPGWHEVAVGLAGRPGLIRVMQEQPLLPMRILPALNAERLNLVLHAGRKPLPRPPPCRVRPQNGLWWVPPESASGQASHDALRPAAMEPAKPDMPAGTGLTGVQRLRLALRTESGSEPSPGFSARELQALPAAEQWLAACRWHQWRDFTNWAALPEVDRANYLLATHRIPELLDSGVPVDVGQRLITLLRVAEGSPAWRQEAQGLGELLAAKTNCPPGCKSILVRLARDLTWIPLPISPSSAGIRPVQVQSDAPQDPSSRIRRALLPPGGTNQFTIAAHSALNASMTLQHPARVQVRAKLVKAGFSPLAPLTVSLQVDALGVRHLPLRSPRPVAVTNFSLAEGSHVVRVWIEDPVVNESVRISLAGRSDDGSNSVWSQSLAEMASENRFFNAATAADPIRFSWKGPALLRLDEWREGRFVSQLRWVPAGKQSVEIGPAPGHTESWYRIFVCATRTNQPEVRPVWVNRKPETVPPPELRLPATVTPSWAQMTDYYRLGGQEKGTWSFGVLAAHRRPFALDGQRIGIVNEFIEADAAYRKLAPGGTIWLTSGALARVHRPGDLTFGLSELIEGRPRVSLLDWAWSGEAFAGSTGPRQQDVEGALHTDIEIGPHYRFSRKLDLHPFAGFFAHYLSLNPSQVAQYNYVDQDLYTKFRYQHRYGWTLGDQAEYQPWLDTLIRGSLNLAGNENFTLDSWGMRGSWNQLLGPLRSQVGFRATQFLADSDRKKSIWRQGVWAGLYAEHWLNGRHRLELGVQFRHDWPHSGDSWFLVLSWDFSQGRGYRDYSPGQMEFRNLRSRSIPAPFNNLFHTGPPGASLP